MDIPLYRGVPLGGIGAGSIELSHDGAIRNISVNNNRTTLDRIPSSPESCAAIRIANNGTAISKILQRRKTAPLGTTGSAPLQTDQYIWRALYPRADFQLNGALQGVSVTWSYYSPLIPYDYEASTLPAILLEVCFTNTHSAAAAGSALFTWENLSGCSRNRRPEQPPPITPVQTWRKVEATMHDGASQDTEADGSTGQVLDIFGLRFGDKRKGKSNFDGEHFLSTAGAPNSEYSFAIWDPADAQSARKFWAAFESNGTLPNCELSTRHAAGALCVKADIQPGERRRIVFALSWYCPRFEINGVDQGNGYTNLFADAFQVAHRCLYHTEYYLTAIRKWHHQLLETSLPDWLARALINNCSVFSSNTLYNRQGQFTLIDSPLEPEAGATDHRLFSSLGNLLFFPRFELGELLQMAQLEDPRFPNHLSRRLGYLSFHEPDFQSNRMSQPELCAILVLSAYRDLLLTGNRGRLAEVYPRLKKLVDGNLQFDRDSDGLPESAPGKQTVDGMPIPGLSSMAAGIWIAALCAMDRFSQLQSDGTSAKKYRDIYRIAAKAFERNYWDAELGYYRLFKDFTGTAPEQAPLASLCHMTQLAGQWYADFLGLGSLFNPAHIRQALDNIWLRNRRAKNLAMCSWPEEKQAPAALSTLRSFLDAAWPSHTLACYAALLISRGQAARGLQIAAQCARTLDNPRGMLFELPFKSYHGNADHHPDSAERHVSALSIWYVYYALAGVQMNMAGKSLVIHPKLNLEKGPLHLILFTPVGIGKLVYEQKYEELYWTRIQLQFESPLAIERIFTPLPDDVEQVRIDCESALGPIELAFRIVYVESTRWLLIEPVRAIGGVNKLQITVTEDEEAAPPDVPNAW